MGWVANAMLQQLNSPHSCGSQDWMSGKVYTNYASWLPIPNWLCYNMYALTCLLVLENVLM